MGGLSDAEPTNGSFAVTLQGSRIRIALAADAVIEAGQEIWVRIEVT
jgi:hypothetical protein